MAESGLFAELLDRGAFVSTERQIRFEETFGGFESWNVDLAVPALSLIGPSGTTSLEAQILGTSAPATQSWLWAWANPSFEGAGSQVAEELRAIGHERGIDELTTPELPFGTTSNEPPDAWWYRIATAAAGLLPGWHGYFPATLQGGTRAPLLVRHPSLELPQPEAARVMRVIAEAAGGIPISDHRLALTAYAEQRGITVTWETGTCLLTTPDAIITVTLNDRDRITQLDAHGR